MPIGAGLAPAGTSIAGYGTPDTAAVPNGATLPDIVTGLPRGGRYINPQTGSYQFTADGRLQGMANVNQLVQLAITTNRGSAVLQTLGQSFTSVQEQQGDFQRQCATAVAVALSDLVRLKLVALLGVTVQPAPGNSDAAEVFFQWKDLTEGPNARENNTRFGP